MLATAFISVRAWSNGGYSANPQNPDYGTHDWLAHHALDWVPDSLDFWIRNNLAIYLYGTELPDNREAPLGDGIGDKTLHHVYYHSDGRLQDDSSARRAQETSNQVISYLTVKDYANAAKWMGVTSHYISDLAVFAHVMGKATDWGAEKHHSDYEEYANERTNSYNDEFNAFLSFDGELRTLSAYDAAVQLAYDTTFDVDGDLTCVWMDQNYDWNNPTFRNRSGESLNLAVNLLADVIYSISQTQQTITTATTTTATSTMTSPLTTTTKTTSLSTSVTTMTATSTATSIVTTIIETTSPIVNLTVSTTAAYTTPSPTVSMTTKTQTTTTISSSQLKTTITSPAPATSRSAASTTATITTLPTTTHTTTDHPTTTLTQTGLAAITIIALCVVGGYVYDKKKKKRTEGPKEAKEPSKPSEEPSDESLSEWFKKRAQE